VVAFVQHVGIGVTAVIDVPIRIAQQNDLAIRVIAVVGPLTERSPQGRGWRDLPHDVDLANALPSTEGPGRKQSQSLN